MNEAHKTHYLSDEQRAYLNDKAGRQQKIIAKLFLKHPEAKLGPGEVHKILFPMYPEGQGKWLITSTRRAMTNLTKAGVLYKTDITADSLNGGTEHKWELRTIHSVKNHPSRNDLLRKHKGKQMDFHGFGWGR